jgi:peptidylprolyl isomerase
MLTKVLALAALLTAALWTGMPGLAGAADLDPQNTLVMQVPAGKVMIKLRPDLAPKHVAQIKKLVSRHFYDGQVFHRVIAGFMAQTGDPTGTGQGGSYEPNLPAEFTDTPYKRGTIGMARTADPNSANSQFFICFDDNGCASLRGQYTVWGEVVSGMEFIDKLAVGEPPETPSKMIKLQLAADAK